MKELIEKLEDARDYTKGRTQSINVALKFEELEFLLQALTSVKSENNSEAMKENMQKAFEAGKWQEFYKNFNYNAGFDKEHSKYDKREEIGFDEFYLTNKEK